MKEVKLGNSDKVAHVDDEDFERVSQHKWTLSTSGYVFRYIHLGMFDGKKVGRAEGLHRFILSTGAEEIDHKNRNKLDYQKHNLRLCTRSQNQANRGPKNGRRFKGTRRNGRVFQARIIVDKKLLYLGTFIAEEDAAKAYDKAAVEHFGEFARLNFSAET